MNAHPDTMIGRPSSVRTRKPAPFRVFKTSAGWVLAKSGWGDGISGFESAGDAIDHAYRNWPWWP